MLRKYLIVLLSSFLVMLTSACGNTEKKQKESYATPINENTFAIKAFEFTIEKPDGWHAQDLEALNASMALNSEIAAGDNEKLKATLKASNSTTFNMLRFSEFTPGTPVDFNPNLIGIAENISTAPGIKRGSDYLFHAKKLLVQTTADIYLADTYGESKIDNISFDTLDATLTVDGQKVQQRYYVTLRDSFALLFIISYSTDAQLIQLETILNTVKFDW